MEFPSEDHALDSFDLVHPDLAPFIFFLSLCFVSNTCRALQTAPARVWAEVVL